jgi:hypothetical protein
LVIAYDMVVEIESGDSVHILKEESKELIGV